MTLKPIHVFLASSNELAPERKEVINLLNEISEDWEVSNRPRIIPEYWEKYSEAYPKNGDSQSVYDEKVKSSDLFFMMAWTKVGKYTKREFEIAQKQFQEGQESKPLMIIFKKSLSKEEKAEKSLDKFFKKNSEYFKAEFDHIGVLEAKIRKELDKWWIKNNSEPTPQPIPSQSFSCKNPIKKNFREVLESDAYDDLDIYNLCIDYEFEEAKVSQRAGDQREKVSLLMKYCQKTKRWSDLHNAIKETAGEYYDDFYPYCEV